MTPFLKLSRGIDALTELVAKGAIWLVLLVTLISAFNAVMRFTIHYSSNAWLEIQWYLFAAIFLLMSGYALLRNAHVRIDLIFGHVSPRTRSWIDIMGTLFFLTPMVVATIYLSIPLIENSIAINEQSSNAGGLVRWPVKLLLPIGLALLQLQAISELIKRIAFLTGHAPDPNHKDEGPSAEEELAAAIKAQKGEA
ncbi:MAG TPA: TRAP transporter small permease subunit [Rhodocyclaceae bacterium]|nr:TRAP transporter small permease subunit [Rhodocyclaceae bacterium]